MKLSMSDGKIVTDELLESKPVKFRNPKWLEKFDFATHLACDEKGNPQKGNGWHLTEVSSGIAVHKSAPSRSQAAIQGKKRMVKSGRERVEYAITNKVARQTENN